MKTTKIAKRLIIINLRAELASKDCCDKEKGRMHAHVHFHREDPSYSSPS